MEPTEEFLNRMSREQRMFMEGLATPAKIQEYLDDIPYVGEDLNRSPIRVMTDRQCHCLDGGVFAAAALRRLGHEAVIVDLLPEPGTDDDHILALYKKNGYWGAIAKSNYAGLRFREPVYRSLRELVMSYFEVFFNVQGQKTLRSYTRPVNLRVFDPLHWMWSDAGLNAIEQALKDVRAYPVITPEMAADLSQVDQRSYDAGMLGTNPEGLFKPSGVTH